jgi:prepilin-type N-terminal cleavage/methylation domain-containing protein
MRLSRQRTPLGFTLGELLLVVAILGVLTAVALPRFGRIRDQAQLGGAMTRLTRAVFAARQSAIQRGKRAYFKQNNSNVWVTIDTTGNGTDSVIVTAALDLQALYGVQITAPAGLTSIEYDPRGVSTQSSKQIFRFQHIASGRVDSLCISKLGNTIREACP